MPALNLDLLRSKLKLKVLSSELALKAAHPQAVAFLENSGIKPGLIRAHAAKLLASGTLAGTLLLAPAQPPHPPSAPSQVQETSVATAANLQSNLSRQLQTILPPAVIQLNPRQEQAISKLLYDTYGIAATAEFQGERLNRDYGYIGQEQHLARFPGDTLGFHAQPLKEGMAPGRGAWGYFVNSKAELTPQLAQIEKYYVAVQTLYLSDWYTRLPYLRDWWKYRKMVVVNPANGKLMVVAVGDSGPAWWTGKHFGGSPEVMQYLDMQDGRQKGPVVMFFLDDPDNSIPLGPIEYNLQTDPSIRS